MKIFYFILFAFRCKGLDADREYLLGKEDVEVRYSECLGGGTFGKVYNGTLKKLNKKVAVKEVAYDPAKFDKIKIDQETASEIQMLIAFQNHPNIVRFYGYFDNAENKTYAIVLEYCKGTIDMTLVNKDIARVFYEIAVAVQYLHARNIQHCDVKRINETSRYFSRFEWRV